MITHVIYHAPELKKVGCCKNLEARIKDYPKGTVIAVLEELHDKTDQEAGDIEFRWAARFKYLRGSHYIGAVSASNAISPEMRREISRSGGKQRAEIQTPEQRKELSRVAREAITATSEQLSEWGKKGGKKRAAQLTPEQKAEAGYKLAQWNAENTTPQQNIERGRKVAALRKSGFFVKDKCPHCGLEGDRANLHRWHFDKCRLKER